jgi:hypothetical protein
MTPEKVIAAFAECRKILDPNDNIPGERNSEWSSLHLLYMCEEGPKLITEGRIEKAMRWLGFIQGALWASDFATLDTLKAMNRKDDNDG